jgi:hypothetical protein
MSKNAAGCLLIVVLIMVGSAVKECSDDGPRHSSPSTLVTPPDTNAARQRDSQYVDSIGRTASSKSDLLTAHQLAHTRYFPHDSGAHRRAVAIIVDSLDKLLRAGNWMHAKDMSRDVYRIMRDEQTRPASWARYQRADERIAAREKAAREATLVQLRQEYARTIETQLLDKGLDVTANTYGPKHTTLRLRYVLAGRVFVHQLGKNEEMFRTLREFGFRKLVVTDGYDFTATWDLQ